MNKDSIREFFDKYADTWDENLTRNEEVIKKILDKSNIVEGIKVLDVATGTGVLFEDYISRGVSSVTGIDISPKMVEIAKEKYPDCNIICADAETYTFDEKFDVVMIYNAFPHFPNQRKLIKNLSLALKEKGRLTIAHGMSMKALEECHSGAAKNVSVPLISKENLAKIMSDLFFVDVMISDDSMYMVSGIKK